MALSTIEQRLYVPSQRQHTDADPGYSFLDLTADNHKLAYCFDAPKTGNIRKFHFRTATVATGGTYEVTLENLDSDLEPDRPIITDATGSVTIASGDDSTWFVVQFTQDIPVTRGEKLAAVLTQSGTGDTEFATALGALNNWPELKKSTNGGSSWSPSSAHPVCLFEYDDGTFEPINGMLPWKSILEPSTFNSGTTPDEKGNKINLPFDCRVTGFYLHCRLVFSDTVDIVLYDNDGSSVLETFTLDNDQETSLADEGRRVYYFAGTYTLIRNTDYRIIVKPTTTSNVVFYGFTTHVDTDTDGLEGVDLGSRVVHTERTDGGSWTDVREERSQIGLIIDQIDLDEEPPTTSASTSATSTASTSATTTASTTASTTATTTASTSQTTTASTSASSTASTSATTTASTTASTSASTTASTSASSTASTSATSTASTSATTSATTTASTSATSTASTSATSTASTSATTSATSTASTSATSTASTSGTTTASTTASTSQSSTASTSDTFSSASTSATTSQTSTASTSQTSTASTSRTSTASTSASTSASVTSASTSASTTNTVSTPGVAPIDEEQPDDIAYLRLNNAGDSTRNPIISGIPFQIQYHKHDDEEAVNGMWISDVDGNVITNLFTRLSVADTIVTVDVTAGVDLTAADPPFLNVIHVTATYRGVGIHVKYGIYVATEPDTMILLDGFNADSNSEPAVFRPES